jgi:hypothetical protein
MTSVGQNFGAFSAFDDVFSFIAMGELYDVCKTLLYKYLQEEIFLILVLLVLTPGTLDFGSSM